MTTRASRYSRADMHLHGRKSTRAQLSFQLHRRNVENPAQLTESVTQFTPNESGRRRQQRVQVAFVEAEAFAAAAAFEHGIGQLGLARLQLFDAFFHRARRDQAIHEHRFVLADAVRAIARLRLGRGIPPRSRSG